VAERGIGLVHLGWKAIPWADTGSMTLLVEGNSLKDGSSVLAKVAQSHSNGSMFIEREAHMCVYALSVIRQTL
jgi:hypothetical protein